MIGLGPANKCLNHCISVDFKLKHVLPTCFWFFIFSVGWLAVWFVRACEC